MKRIPRDSYRVLKYIYNAPKHTIHEEHIYVKFGVPVADFAITDLRRRQYVAKAFPGYFDLPRSPADDLLFVTEPGEYYLKRHKRHIAVSILISLLDSLLSFLPWKPKAANLLGTIFDDDSEK